MEITRYAKAPDVEKVIKQVLKECQPDLAPFNFLAVFDVSKKPPVKGGKVVLAKTVLLPELMVALLGNDEDGIEADWAIIVTHSSWMTMDEKQRVALVHHQLCHAYYHTDKKGNKHARVAEHDLHEFNEVVRLRGLWCNDVERMARAMQDCLPGLDEKAAKSEARPDPAKKRGAVPAGPAKPLAGQEALA